MSQIKAEGMKGYLRRVPDLLAVFLLPILMVVALWNPCDSVSSAAHGDSLFLIAGILSFALLTAVGGVLDSSSGRPPRRERVLGRWNTDTMFWSAASLFGVWLLIGVLQVRGHGNYRFAMNGFWQWNSILVIAFGVRSLAHRIAIVRSVIIFIVSLAVGITLYAIYQYAVISPAQRQEFADNPVLMLTKQGIAPNSSGAMLFANRIKSTEPTGPFILTNSLAGFLVSVAILVIGFFVDSSFRIANRTTAAKNTSLVWLFSSAGVVLLMFLVLLLTKSRTALIAFLFGTVSIVFFHSSVRTNVWAWMIRNKMIVGTAVGVVALVVFAIYSIDPLIISESTKSLSYRMDYWRGAFQLICEQPLFGYGPFNFQSTYLKVKLPSAAESPADPHNFLFEVAHAGGLPLLLILLFAGVQLVRSFYLELGHDVPLQLKQLQNPLERLASIVFWCGASAAAFGLALFNFFLASDDILIACGISILGCASTSWFFMQRFGFPISQITPRAIAHSSRYVLWIAVASTLLHLCASGGWMLPGVMLVPALLVGIITGVGSVSDRDNSISEQEVRPAKANDVLLASSVAARWFGLLGFTAFGALFVTTMFLPTTRGLDAFSQMSNAPAGRLDLDDLKSLAFADPDDPDLARAAMEICVANLERPLSKERRNAWRLNCESWIRDLQRRDPGHALVFEETGRCLFRIAATEADLPARETDLAEAAKHFEDGTRLYPASAELAIQAAVAEELRGRHEAALKQIEKAVQIDEITPHLDRKLRAIQVYFPVALEPPNRSLRPEARKGTPRDWAWAEPLVRWVRTVPE